MCFFGSLSLIKPLLVLRSEETFAWRRATLCIIVITPLINWFRVVSIKVRELH